MLVWKSAWSFPQRFQDIISILSTLCDDVYAEFDLELEDCWGHLTIMKYSIWKEILNILKMYKTIVSYLNQMIKWKMENIFSPITLNANQTSYEDPVKSSNFIEGIIVPSDRSVIWSLFHYMNFLFIYITFSLLKIIFKSSRVKPWNAYLPQLFLIFFGLQLFNVW